VTLNLEAADIYCRTLTRRHYENFSVASRFVDARTRLDLERIYAFCRTTDDLGDESPDGTALARLERWRSEVEALIAGIPPVHPVLVALSPTIEKHSMPMQPFLDLIAANVQDQSVKRYQTWDELLGYCRLSAAPVGRMVLTVFGVRNSEAERLSDNVCIGLQLANHAQDVSRDAVLGRRYLVESDVATSGITGAAQAMVARARALLASGTALERYAPRPLRLQLALYRMGGLAICDAIDAIGYQTEQNRPSVSAVTKVSVVVRAALESFARGRPA
jgi:squalene synthase HpnC